MATKLLRKLTLKDVVGSKAEILKVAQTGCIAGKDEAGKPITLPKGNVVPLATILGQVTSIKADSSDLGPYLKLMGSFEATNLQTGEVVPVNGTCILPNFIADAIGVAIQAGAASVDFAVQINVQYNEDAAVMYEYSAQSLLPPTEAKPISGLKAMLANAGIALPAPLKAPALAAPAPAAAPAEAPAAAPAEAPAGKKGGKK